MMKYLILMLFLMSPSVSAATFGDTDTTGHDALQSIDDNIYGTRFTMGATSGIADSITFYSTDGGGTGGDKCKAAVYSLTLELLGTTAEQDPGVVGQGWQSLEVTTPFDLQANTDYYIVAWANFGAQLKFVLFTGLARYRHQNKDYDALSGTFPDPGPLRAESGAHQAAIYVTYTEVSGDNLVPMLDTKPIRGVGRGIGK